MNNKTKGASLVQYAIVLAFISISCIFVYTCLGKQIVDILNKYLSIFTSNSATANQNMLIQQAATGSVAKSSLGGTPSQPQELCSAGKCAIDYGSFVLNGVPDDFSNFITNAGNSGGTDQLATLVEQIANQLEQEGNPGAAQAFRDQANLGHFISSVQDVFEEKTKQCSNITDSTASVTCYKSMWVSTLASNGISIPDNIKTILPDFDTSITMENFLWMNNLASNSDLIQYQYDTNAYNNLLNSSVTLKMQGLNTDIQVNSSIADEMKLVEDQLRLSIENISNSMLAQAVEGALVSELNTPTVVQECNKTYNVSTGQIEEVNCNEATKQISDFNNITNPQYSEYTNFDSTLICVTGEYDDTGKACK